MYLLSMHYCKCDNFKISMSNFLSCEIGKGSESYSSVFHLIMKDGEKKFNQPGYY